jgi:hypothetical protein
MLADRLEDYYGRDVKVLALEIDERQTVIRALEDPPAGLEELRGVLLRERVWLREDGLARLSGRLRSRLCLLQSGARLLPRTPGRQRPLR